MLWGRATLLLTALTVVLLVGIGVLGTSAAVAPLGPRRPHPPFSLAVRPGGGLTLLAVLVMVALAVAGVACGLVALDRGWRPSPRRLFGYGCLACVAVLLVPPVGSADHISYAAYGRIAAEGGDPYVDSPQTWRFGADVVAGAVQPPWRWAPSVYGPVGTAEQWLASVVGRDSLHTTVAVLALLNAVAFVLTGWLLMQMAAAQHGRRDGRAVARTQLLWTLNPLLLYLLVAGAHIDALTVLFGVAGLYAVRRSALLAGVLVGLGIAVKAPVALFLVAVVWGYRRRLRDAVLAGGAGVLTAGAAFLAAGPHVFDQLSRASTYISLATPWRLVYPFLLDTFGNGPARTLISRSAFVLLALLVVVLARLAPRGAEPRPGDDPRAAADAAQLSAVRAAFLLSTAWLLTAPYSLPWYDALAWAPLALLPAARIDWLLLVRTGVLALAYAPGRADWLLSEHLQFVMVFARRQVVTRFMLALLLVLVALALWPHLRSRWGARRARGRARSLPAGAAPPG